MLISKMKTDLTVAGYIFHEDKLLLIHHEKLDKWLPVGGHIEQNETPDQALVREIKEETNLNVKIIGETEIPIIGATKQNLANPFYVNVHSVGDHDHCGLFYICKSKNPNELNINKELKNFMRVSKEKLKSNEIPEDVKVIGNKAFELIIKH